MTLSSDKNCTKQEGEIKVVTVYLGLGSNMGRRQYNLSRAMELLSPQAHVEQVSSLYETEPVGYLEQPLFLNAVLRATTSLSPWELLANAKEVEKELGRVDNFPNGPRPIDIDILFYNNQVINSPELTVPHSQLEERAFVLVPLAEIAPALRHPVSRRTVREMLENTTGLDGVKKWTKEAEHV